MKITLATIKSFINKNRANLYINCKTSFDGMTDCVMPTGDGNFEIAKTPKAESNHINKLGIQGAWFVLRGGDCFIKYENEKFTGFEVYNSCGSFILAIPK